MAITLTAEGAKESLTTHVAAKGIEVFLKYGRTAATAAGSRLRALSVHDRL
jgi:hypothetical protein